jgi:NADH-quinone oxidoreductase subunit J
VAITEWILGTLLILSSLGVILAPKPVHSGISFLLTLLTLSAFYLQLSAQFIAVMQVLIYAGAILVIFIFVIVLFQDAHQKMEKFAPRSFRPLLVTAAILFSLTLAFLLTKINNIANLPPTGLPEGYGTAQALGKTLYLDFFFPFEAVIVLFLIAVIGALYVGRKN